MLEWNCHSFGEVNLHGLQGVRQVLHHQARHEVLSFLPHQQVRRDLGVQLGPSTEKSNYYYYRKGFCKY